MMLCILECAIEVFLDLWNFFQIVWHLEALHVCSMVRTEAKDSFWAFESVPCTILASLWYLLKFSNFLSGLEGEGLKLGLPSRQKVTSVR